MVANCLLRVVTKERDYMLVRSVLRTTLPEVLIYWLRLILEGVVPKRYCVGSFDKSRDEHYVKCVTSVVSRRCEDDIQDDVKNIVNVKNERGIGYLKAAIMHMEIGKKLFPHNLKEGDRDLEQRMAFDTLIYISSLLFGKASSFFLPWRRVFKLTNVEGGVCF
ncbi:hypothetical protein OROMI_008799 [Orobanche minor]